MKNKGHEPNTDIQCSVIPDKDLIADLRRTNLNLLPILHKILSTMSVSRAAQELNLTQPAVSRALRQLRDGIGDEILVNTGKTTILTPRAQALQEPLEALLRGLHGITQKQTEFDPKTEKAHFVLNTADYVAVLLAPKLTEFCKREAPNVTFDFTMVEIDSIDTLNKFDFVISPQATMARFGKRVNQTPIWQDKITCLVRAQDETVGTRIAKAQLKDRRHVRFAIWGHDPATLSLLSPTIRFATEATCSSSSFFVLGSIIETSDHVAILPAMVAKALEGRMQVRSVELEDVESNLEICVFSSQTINRKRGHQWFFNLITQCATDLASGNGVS